MSGLTRYSDDKPAHTLARGLQRSTWARGLADQSRCTLRCQLFCDGARAVAAGFFIRNQPDRHRTRKSAFYLTQRAQSEHDLHDSALHVEHARSAQLAVDIAPGHRVERAQVVDGVIVAKQQYRFGSARTCEVYLQMVTSIRVAEDFDSAAEHSELFR